MEVEVSSHYLAISKQPACMLSSENLQSSRMTSYLSRQEQQQHRLNYASQMTSNASNTTTANTTASSNTASAYYRLRDIPTPTAAHSRYVRPRRNSSPSDVASPAGAATTTTRRRPEPLRPEDQASTTLGRRVALRSAAMRRSQQQQHFESGGNAREPPGFLPGRVQAVRCGWRMGTSYHGLRSQPEWTRGRSTVRWFVFRFSPGGQLHRHEWCGERVQR